MRRKLHLFLATLLGIVTATSCSHSAIDSIETPYTIVNVRNAQIDGKPVIIGGSYDGVVVAYDYSGNLIWENKLSGYLNFDLFSGDIDGDNSDEILAANSDGNIYCMDDNGDLLWKFRKNDAPMLSLCVIHKDGKPYIACGGFDMNLYYLDADGNEIDAIDSSTYSKERTWGPNPPADFHHVTSFLRPVNISNGEQMLLLNAANHGMSHDTGIYMFKPLAREPYFYATPALKCIHGSLTVIDAEDGEHAKVLMGTTAMNANEGFSEVDVESGEKWGFPRTEYAKDRTDGFGYRVAQSQMINDGGEPRYLMLYGRQILLIDADRSTENTEVFTLKDSHWDVVKDLSGSKLILASEQSGGSCIHIVDLNNDRWKEDVQNIEPKGKIEKILSKTEVLRGQLRNFNTPKWEEGERPKVYFMSNRGGSEYSDNIIDNIHKNYPSPIFLNDKWIPDTQDPKTWCRDTMSNEIYRNKRDGRKRYQAKPEDILAMVKPEFEGDSKGFSTWGGHGNDPFFYDPAVTRKFYDFAKPGQKTILIYPEFQGVGDNVQWLMNSLMYPMADYARKHEGMLYIRSKNIFWLANVYEPHWNRLISGEYADVFIPTMEETACKTQELSLSARLGVWASGSTDSWGSRCARDNPSYFRLREYSHQMFSNHFLCNMIYHISYGAQYLENALVDPEYISILWELIAKGLLYVPTRDQIVSFNPVHLSMLSPDPYFLHDGTEFKWLTRFNQREEDNNKMVFSRMDGSWPAAPNTEWDFSTYAANVKDRRLNFISAYNQGMVLLTPPYDPTAPRGKFEEHLNPIYKGKTIEFFSDGRNYYSDANKTKSYGADSYYKRVVAAIKEGEKLMPLTVKGEVGWVTAQTAPKHLRLTIIDGGYVNPSDKVATIKIEAAKVKSITDLASGETLAINNGECAVEIPCGMFRFLDVELLEEL